MKIDDNSPFNPLVSEAVRPLPEVLAYDINQAAFRLNMSTKTVRRLICRGRLTPCKALRKILIPKEQVENFFTANCDVPKSGR